MISVLILLGCFASPTSLNPTETEWDRATRCSEYNEVHHCYSLRESKNRDRRFVGLSRACKAKYEDSCVLLYQLNLERDLPSLTFAAARDACDSGSAEHCRIALEFETDDPDLRDRVDNERMGIEARLAELEQAAK